MTDFFIVKSWFLYSDKTVFCRCSRLQGKPCLRKEAIVGHCQADSQQLVLWRISCKKGLGVEQEVPHRVLFVYSEVSHRGCRTVVLARVPCGSGPPAGWRVPGLSHSLGQGCLEGKCFIQSWSHWKFSSVLCFKYRAKEHLLDS